MTVRLLRIAVALILLQFGAHAAAQAGPEWQAINKKHQGLDVLMKDEIYNRYVEVVAR